MKHIQKIAPFAAMAVGVVLAITTSAFKTPHTNKSGDAMIAFEYVAPATLNPYSQTNVEDLSNWQYTADSSACTPGSVKPCKVYVSPTYVDGTGPSNYALDPSYSISASNSTVSHVIATSDGTSTGIDFSNRPN